MAIQNPGKQFAFLHITVNRGRQGTMGEQLSPDEKFNLITRNLQVRAPKGNYAMIK